MQGRTLAVAGRPLVQRVAGLFHSPRARAMSVHVLLLVALLSQAVALLVLGYLVDLSISLFELWADLARKHLEITMS